MGILCGLILESINQSLVKSGNGCMADLIDFLRTYSVFRKEGFMGIVNKIAIIGLGYVGLPTAVAFADKVRVIGFDIDKSKIKSYQKSLDITGKIENKNIQKENIELTNDESKIRDADFIIVAVPTPVYNDHRPDLRCLKSASQIVGRQMKKGAIVVYESTVYPGCTEEICVPILEKESGLKCPVDFKVGYSPERINPGDNVNHMSNIVKIMSGVDKIAVNRIKETYKLILDKEPFIASNIRTAEAIKLIENSQRDINVGFINESAIILNQLGIDTKEVIAGMQTKWNALNFTPGLVGGHCIGIDPYYLTYVAERLGIFSTITSLGRIINEKMGNYVTEVAIKQLILAGKTPRFAKVAIFGFSYKENCNDIRNSKVFDIVTHLKMYGIDPIVVDPLVRKSEVMHEYKVSIMDIEEITGVDCLILAVAHNVFKNMHPSDISQFLKKNEDNKKNVLIDVKRIFSADDFSKEKIIYFGI